MSKVSVIFEDNAVVVDGVALILASLPAHDASWRALQWDGARGHIEKQNGARQQFFTDAAVVQPFIDAHTAATQQHVAAGGTIGHPLPPHVDPPPMPEPPPPPAPQRTIVNAAPAPVAVTGAKQL